MRAIFALFFVAAVAVGSPIERELLETLFRNYSSETRPVLRRQDTVTANLSFTLTALDNVDLESGDFEAHGWLHMEWEDVNLQWDALAFDNIDSLHVDSDKLWKPDIKLYNGPFASVDNTNAIVYSSGKVLWVPPVKLSAKCQLEAYWFPFDKQSCKLIFGSWTLDGNKLDLQVAEDAPEVSIHPEWQLLGVEHRRVSKTYKCCPEPYISIEANVTVKRHSYRYINIDLMPKVLTVCLGILTMIFPRCLVTLRLLLISLLMIVLTLQMCLQESPKMMNLMTVANGNLFMVLASLFVCNCGHLCRWQKRKYSRFFNVLQNDVDKEANSDAETVEQSAFDSWVAIGAVILSAGTAVVFMLIPHF